ncbi:glycosyltransferase family 1 protein [Burkholderia sp. Cy-637]|uniref:glycosyltransferase family 4 protein n=1 Tax=Burkholderia sp. Cy-637 TaxID=2608327 RepID=UPI00141DD912|nr:glycosyltransferase family 1 protein [Burkholderia sp. Cy-637]NIF88775.1 glycosyltransferase family 4 protein [Burkholderia sp. Cy-637]
MKVSTRYILACLQHMATWWRLPLAQTARRRLAPLRDVAASRTPGPRQLLIDVSIIAAHDAGTGIQRVVRSLVRALLASPPEGYVVRTVKATRRQSYTYANQYQARMTGIAGACDDEPVRVASGDLFLGLDLASRIAPSRQRDFLCWRASGVRFAFIVYDMLPALHPQWFTRRAVRSFDTWLTTLTIHADALFCISASVAEQTRQRIGISSLPVWWFHLGADLPVAPAPTPSAACICGLRILMVGTIEPRKGHAIVLDAFERLWRDGLDAQLVIVGRAGWAVEALVEKIETHRETGRRLQWHASLDDSQLEQLYRTVNGLVLASEGEGFGLPIIEAARYRLPLLLRDLPVFREIAREHATYFRAQDGAALASQLKCWMDDLAAGTAPTSEAIEPLTWSASASQLKGLIARLDTAS